MTTVQKLLHSVFSPSRPIREPKDKNHNKNSNENGISSRCHVADPTRIGVPSSGERLPTGCAFAGQQSQPERGISPQPSDSRCEFRSSDGRQCRNQQAQFCVHHASKKQRDPSSNGSPDPPVAALVGLEGLCGDLTTATSINRALSQVFLLMAQGRISQKQAVAFGYITQLLLQTVPGIRSEYVSVHGYRDWEANLKSKIVPLPYMPPAPSESPAPQSPTDPATPSDRTPSPDYVDLFRRSRDMMAGKLDTTPEGRREANTLALELELMKPAPAKPPRDFFGRTVALVRRLQQEAPRAERLPTGCPFGASQSIRAHQPKKSAAPQAPSTPPIANPPAASSTSLAQSSAVSAPPRTAPAQSPASPQPTHESVLCSSGCGVSQPTLRPLSPAAQTAASASTPSEANVREVNFVAPPSRRPAEPCSSGRGAAQPALRPLDQSPNPRPKQDVPAAAPGTTLARTGHTTDWYAPPSWSAPRPDPFPSRQEKLKRRLRAMSDRRRQHQMQNRAFWH